MDLGIAGRRAIVCASSKGLGRGCAQALAREGVHVVVNGRHKEEVEATATAIRTYAKGSVSAVTADVSTNEGRAELLAACPEPDILMNNAGGPPPGDFRDLDERRLAQGHGPEYDHADHVDQGDGGWHGEARIRSHRQHYVALS